MEEQRILSIAAILAEWSPLGARGSSVPDLALYRTEAIDMIMALELRGTLIAPATTDPRTESSIRSVAGDQRLRFGIQ